MKSGKFYMVCCVCFFAYNLNGQTAANKRFIDSSIKVANRLVESVFGDTLIRSSVLFDKEAIISYGGTNNPFVRYNDYKNNFKPIEIEFSYDFILKKDTIGQLRFQLDSNFKMQRDYIVVHSKEAYEENADVVTLIGWKNVLLGNFKYDYNNIAKIKNKTSRDTCYEAYLVYKHSPTQIIKGGNFFVGVKYYWLVTVSTITKIADGSYEKRSLKSLTIDVHTGKVMDETYYEDRKNKMSYR